MRSVGHPRSAGIRIKADQGIGVNEQDDEAFGRQNLFRWFTEIQVRSRRQEDLALLRDYYDALPPAEQGRFRAWVERLAEAAGNDIPRGSKVEVEIEGVVCPRRGAGDPVYMTVRFDPRILREAVLAWDGGKAYSDGRPHGGTRSIA
jgi:hypothetical protein